MSISGLVRNNLDRIKEWRSEGLKWGEISEKLGLGSDKTSYENVRKAFSKYKDRVSEDSKILHLEDRYVYNPETDAYITFLSSSPHPVVVPGSVHKSMLQAYSNWDGEPATINEICRQFGFTRQQFEEYKRIHGWTHDREPLTDEEYLSEDYDENQVLDNLISLRRQALYKRFEKEKWAQIQRNAQKWEEFETYVLRHFDSRLREYTPPKAEIIVRSDQLKDNHLAVLGTTDAHLGKLDKDGKYDLDSDAETLINVTSQLLGHASMYNLERIAFILGSDYLHVDTDGGTTTRGTHVSSTTHYQEILFCGCMTAVTMIDMCREIAPVSIIPCPGNHDRTSSWFLTLFLYSWFRGYDDVDIRLTSDERNYVLYGDSLLGFSHGDLIKKRDLSSVMAAEVPKLWGDSSRRYWFQGHLHHEQVLESGGVKIYQMPSPSSVDRWHYRKGYVSSQRAASAYIVHRQKGVISAITAPVDDAP